MNIRRYNPEEYEEIVKWAEWHKEPLPDRDQFPAETTFVGEEGGKPLYVFSIILTNTRYCIVDNFFRNPFAMHTNRGAVIKTGQEFIEEKAKLMGYKGIMIWATKDKPAKLYEWLGYKPVEERCVPFIKGI